VLKGKINLNILNIAPDFFKFLPNYKQPLVSSASVNVFNNQPQLSDMHFFDEQLSNIYIKILK
jgi:hypothetical protein